tara:strand:+ start:3778 stop:3897 length:120 start_codon:yes stop_codon:yes gene_type:complete
MIDSLLVEINTTIFYIMNQFLSINTAKFHPLVAPTKKSL